MKGKRTLRKLISVGVGLAALYWVIESAAMVLARVHFRDMAAT